MEKIISEIRDLLLHPVQTFVRLKAEEDTRSKLTKSVLLYLAAIPAIAGFIGRVVIGQSVPFVGYYHVPFFSGLLWALLMFALGIVIVYLVAFVINGLSPNFGGERSQLNAFKLSLYSFMPLFVLGVFSIIPALSGLYILGLYGIYLFYVGCPVLMSCPEDKALPFTVVVSLLSILFTVLFYRVAHLAIVNNMPNF